MTGKLKKDAADHIPYCADQGMSHLCGATLSGVSVQWKQFTMVAGGVFNFVNNGLTNMASSAYGVFIQNHSDAADEATVDPATRTQTQFTIVGPDNNDVLDVLIIGPIAGQLTE